jgi:hypothetical protein
MLLLATSCANPKRSSIRYSPPNVQPVREKLIDAKTSVVAAVSAADAVQSAIAEAKAANTNEKVGHALGLAESKAKELIAQLQSAQGSIGGAGDNLTLYDSAARNQTVLLNNAITRADASDLRADAAVEKYHHLKFFLCLLAAAAAGLLVFQFRGLLRLLGPWGFAAYAVVPGAVFAFVWLRF